MSTFDRLQTIISDCIGIDPEKVTMSSNLEDDLGMDSLDAVEMLMATEVEFDTELDDDEFEKVKTVGDAVILVERAIA